MQMLVLPDGSIRCIYNEAIDVATLGRVRIRRGSHVEPNQEGKWIADLSPVHGPVLGPFPHRSEALQAEVAWLNEHWLMPNHGDAVVFD